jgi:hypothetical protein
MKPQKMVFAFSLGLAVVFLGVAVENAHGRGGGGFHGGGFHGGGFDRGGFSREGPAASGSFASRAGSMGGHEGNLQAGHQQYAAGAQASRQQEANRLQSSREQTAQGMQSSAQQYRGGYPYAGAAYPGWDAGGAFAGALAGGAIGAAAASRPSTSTGYAATEPCANAAAVTAGGTTYFHCATGWYMQAYGSAGPTYIAVNRPPM